MTYFLYQMIKGGIDETWCMNEYNNTKNTLDAFVDPDNFDEVIIDFLDNKLLILGWFINVKHWIYSWIYFK